MTFTWLWNLWGNHNAQDCSHNLSGTSSASSSVINLTAGNDTYANNTKIVEKLDGLAGVDTATFTYAASNCLTISTASNGYHLVSLNGNQLMYVRNVERLQFTDATYVYNSSTCKWVKEVAPVVTSLTDGADSYTDKPGVEFLDGKGGTDTLVINGNGSAMTITSGTNGFSILSIGGQQVIQFKNMERIELNDSIFVLNSSGQWVIDSLKLTSGNDTYVDAAGVEKVDGLAGTDTVTIASNASNVTFTSGANGFIIVNVNGQPVIQVKNIEKLQFTDASYTLNSSGQFVSDFRSLTSGDDDYINVAGVEKIDGLAGDDIVVFATASSTMTGITTNADGSYTVAVNGQPEIIIKNIEALEFTDGAFVNNGGNWEFFPFTSDVINLTANDDIYNNAAGVEKVDGLAGTDTVKFAFSATTLTSATTTADGFLSLSFSGQEEIQVRNVEKLEFTDGSWINDGSGWTFVPAGGGGGSGIINLTSGNDTYTDVPGVEKVDGLAGTDTIVLGSPLSSVTGISETADGFLSLSLSGQEAIQFRNVERVQFTDVTLVKNGSNWSVEVPPADTTINLTPNDDTYVNVAGVEKVNGLAGTDTVVFNAALANLTGISTSADGLTTIMLNGQEAIQFRNFERVEFCDAAFFTDGSGNWHTDPLGVLFAQAPVGDIVI